MRKIKYSKFVVALSVAAIVMVLGITARSYAVSNNITEAQMQNPSANKELIGRKVLTDTGMIAKYPDDEIQDISIYYGNITGDNEKEAIVSVKVTPKNTIVAAYKPVNGEYEYIGEIGEFYDVKNIQFMPIETLGRSIALVTDDMNQNLGSYENSRHIRGYNYVNGGFRRVLDIPERITANWNYLWDTQGETDKSDWQRIAQTSDVNYTDGSSPVISITQYQRHLISDDKTNKNVPSDDTYNVAKERVVSEIFLWNDEWESFILGEKKDKATGEKVAILQDFGSSPYALLEDFGDNRDKVRILRKNGKSEIVYKNTLEDIDSSTSAA